MLKYLRTKKILLKVFRYKIKEYFVPRICLIVFFSCPIV